MKYLKKINEFWQSSYADQMIDQFQHKKESEGYTQKDFDKIKELLEVDCGKFLDEIKQMLNKKENVKFSSLVYRGLREYKYDIPGLVTKKPRTDRTPKDMSKKVSDDIDDKFMDKFGKKLRSSGVFCSKLYDTASRYSYDGDEPFVFFPIGDNYKYFWSENVVDLYTKINANPWYWYIESGNDQGYLEELLDTNGILRVDFVDIPEEYDKIKKELHDTYYSEYDEFLKSFVDGYTEGTVLSEVGKQELTFVCDKYYLVDAGMIPFLMEWLEIETKETTGVSKNWT